MKPILIFEHIDTSGPGLFETFLNTRSIPYRILYPNHGEEVPDPEDISSYSGLCFLGGTESVTEPTNTMLKEIDLIKTAKGSGMPVIGHCLGGQLISKALGGEVNRQHFDEFGWSRLYSENNQASREWLAGMPTELFAMQWHSDTFTLPRGATRILWGGHCINQAFVFGNTLAMQFHIEIDAVMIEHWSIDLVEKHPARSESVQSGKQIMDLKAYNYEVSRKLAEQLYSKWAEDLD